MSQTQTVGTVATTVRTGEDGMTRVVYHSTAVVAFNDKIIKLDSGGWLTKTTKLRINQAANQYKLGFQVFQKDFDWFVAIKDFGDNGEGYDWDHPLTFEDGMIIERGA